MATKLLPVSVYIDPAVHQWATKRARAEGRSLSQFIARVLLETSQVQARVAPKIDWPQSDPWAQRAPTPVIAAPDPEIESERERREWDPDAQYEKELSKGKTAIEARAKVHEWIEFYDREDLADWEPLGASVSTPDPGSQAPPTNGSIDH
jgi:hypothetical protein